MNKDWMNARKAVGLPKFERECRKTYELGRLKKAYKIPGTKEAGQYEMLIRRAYEIQNS